MRATQMLVGLAVAVGMALAATSGMAFDTNTVSGLEFWVKADAGVENAPGVPAANGETVTNWVDQSGSGYDASQATAGDRPVYVTNGINGHAALRFDDSQFLDALSYTPSGTMTVFLVRQYVLTGNTGIALGSRSAANGFHIGHWGSASPYKYLIFQAWDSSDNLLINVGPNFGDVLPLQTVGADAAIDTVVIGASSIGIYMNGLKLAVKSGTAPVGANAPLRIGAVADAVVNFPLNGYVGEVLIYSRPLSSSEVQTVNEYLMNKYGTPDPYLPASQTAALMRNGQPNPGYEVDGWRVLEMWLDASEITASDLRSGTYVTNWSDRSYHGRDMVQATDTYQPILTNALNGKPVVRFDGNDNYMQTPGSGFMGGGKTYFFVYEPAILAADHQHFIASDHDTVGGYEGMLYDIFTDGTGAGSAIEEDVLVQIGDDLGSWNAWVAIGDTWDFSEHSAGVPRIAAVVASPAGVFTYADGTQLPYMAGPPPAVVTNGFDVGASVRHMAIGADVDGADAGSPVAANCLNGDIAEILIYSTALDTNQMNQVGYYLQKKYGLTGAYTGAGLGTVIFIR